MLIVFQILFVILITGSLVFYLACAFFTHRFFTAKIEIAQTDQPPVSIMIPACGVDPGAWENWSSFCHQNYPEYEVLFGVTDPQDPAIPVLEKLVATFPNYTRLFTDLKPKGVNYKDSNLSYLLAEAKYEYIIFADSDIRVNPDYIHTVINPLADPKVGMVTCAFIGYNPQSLGAAMASFSRCFDFIPSLLISQVLDGGLKCAIGSTIATRKNTLADYGGLQFNRIGSDYNIGKRAALAGYKVELSRYVLEADTGKEAIADLFRRELRWARTIRFNRGFQYYTMIFCYGTVFCFPLLIISGFANWTIGLTMITLIIRYLQVFGSIIRLKAPQLTKWLWALLLRDFLTFFIWLVGCFGTKVYWRGRFLTIQEDGVITE
jgi:ceramide glucosyltransferase